MSKQSRDPKQWAQLLEATQRYRDLAPWQWMYDTPLIGVQDHETGETGYCSVVGAAGESLGLIVFRGATGFWSFTRFLDDTMSLIEREVAIRNMHTLSFVLGARDEVDEPIRKLYRELGYRFRGVPDWPVFNSYVPGFSNWPLEEDEVRLMTLYMEAIHAFATTIREDESFHKAWVEKSEPQSFTETATYHVLCLIPALSGSTDTSLTTPYGEYSFEWRQVVPQSPVRIDALYDVHEAEARKQQLEHRDAVWEFDVMPLPMPIGDGKSRAATTELTMCVDTDSDLILGFDMTAGDEPSRPVETLLRLIDEVGFIPSAVAVSRRDVWHSLSSVAEALGVDLVHRQEVPYLEDALFTFLESMGVWA